jgi:hypothetical protein
MHSGDVMEPPVVLWQRHFSDWSLTRKRLVLQVYTTYRYTFDRVYGPNSEQAEVYDHSARDAVHQALEVCAH